MYYGFVFVSEKWITWCNCHVGSIVQVTDIADADKEPPKRKYSYYDRHDVKPTLKPASKATPENIARAKIIIDRLEANGGV